MRLPGRTGGLLCLFTIPLYCATIVNIVSEGSAGDPDEYNELGLNVVVDPVHPAWRAPLSSTDLADWIGDPVTSAWISIGQTGDTQTDGFEPVENWTTVTFYQSFFLPAGDYIGSISVMADDTAQVWLNDILLFDYAADQPGQTHCSDTPIGCLEGTVGWYIGLPPDLLVAGDNLLRFVVWQNG